EVDRVDPRVPAPGGEDERIVRERDVSGGEDGYREGGPGRKNDVFHYVILLCGKSCARRTSRVKRRRAVRKLRIPPYGGRRNACCLFSDAASRRGIEHVRAPGFRRKGEPVAGVQVRPSVRDDRQGNVSDPDYQFRLCTHRLDDDHFGGDAAAVLAGEPDVLRANAVLHDLA